MGVEAHTYAPVGKKGLVGFEKQMQKLKDKNSHKKKNKERDPPTKTKQKNQKVWADGEVVQACLNLIPMNDVVSTDVYCICRKPFVEKSVKKSWESETDFTIRQAESQMIQCEGCDEWFHYKCIGLKYDSEIPEVFKCDMCKATTNSF